MTKRIGVLLSGRGSNFEALAESVSTGRIPNAEISIVISNKPGAVGLERAQARGIPARAIPSKGLEREIYDRQVAALLQEYKVESQRQALDYGVKFAGCTVHFVDENLDAGPIILQAVVPVHDSDDEHTLSECILKEEHRIYTEAVKIVLEGNYKIAGRRVIRSL